MSESPFEAPHYGTFKIIPFFRSNNIDRTVAFYRDVLHFTVGGVHSETESTDSEATFASLFIGEKADANIYFLPTVPASRAMIGMRLIGLENYYSRLKEEGVLGEINAKVKGGMIGMMEDKPWGYRQFEVRDEDGNDLTFFAFLSGDKG